MGREGDMVFKIEIHQFDIQIGRLFFRAYTTQGPGWSLKFGKSSQHLVTLWAWRLMLELAWLHKEGCDCFECIPF